VNTPPVAGAGFAVLLLLGATPQLVRAMLADRGVEWHPQLCVIQGGRPAEAASKLDDE